MSLDWSLAKIRNYKTLCWVEDPDTEAARNSGRACSDGKIINPVTNALIWKCMAVGMNSISEKNWREFYARVHVLEKLHGASLHVFVDGEHSEQYLTPKDVHQHIGLATNVKSEPMASWRKRLMEAEVTSALHDAERWEHGEMTAEEAATEDGTR